MNAARAPKRKPGIAPGFYSERGKVSLVEETEQMQTDNHNQRHTCYP